MRRPDWEGFARKGFHWVPKRNTDRLGRAWGDVRPERQWPL